jgi:NADP-dependent 3-hydroxy acid dehydrogenase YdfG
VLAGAAPGFGAAIAKRFAAAGYRVVGLARSTEFGRQLEGELAGDRAAYRHFTCDVTRPESVGEDQSFVPSPYTSNTTEPRPSVIASTPAFAMSVGTM